MYTTVTSPSTVEQLRPAPMPRSGGLQLGARPDSGFDEPLGLLSDCHRRIERFLDQIIAVVEAQADRSRPVLTRAECYDLAAALRVFPGVRSDAHPGRSRISVSRLRRSTSRSAHLALAALEVLEADHEAADTLHAQVSRTCLRWLETGALGEVSLARLWDDLNRLREIYRRHITVEDTRIFPLAARAIPAAQLREIGREMARRRGIDIDLLPAERFALRHAVTEADAMAARPLFPVQWTRREARQ